VPGGTLVPAATLVLPPAGAPLGAGALAAAVRGLLATWRPRLWLGVEPPPAGAAAERHPKRAARRDLLLPACPELAVATAGVGEPPVLRPSGAFTLALPDAPAAAALARLLHGAAGGHVRARAAAGEAGRHLVTWSPEPCGDPGDDVPTDLVFAAPAGEAPAHLLAERLLGGALGALCRDGRVAATPRRLTALRGEALGAASIADREERLAAFAAGLAEPAAAASAPPAPTAAPPAAGGELWDQVAVLCAEGASDRVTADPLLVGPLPAASAALRDAGRARSLLPLLRPETCTACGACWAACPQGAIGAWVVPPRAVLEHGLVLARDHGGNPEPLRPLLSRLATALDSEVVRQGGGAAGPLLDAAFGAVAAGGGLPPPRLEAARAAFALLQPALAALPLIRLGAPAAAAGEGELLVLAVDPWTCDGCGLCVAECAPGALTARHGPAPSATVAGALRAAAGLPAPAPASLERLARAQEPGPVAAALLDPAAGRLLRGGGPPEGAGDRLALRQLLALASLELGPRRHRAAEAAAALADSLRREVRELLARALPDGDGLAVALAALDRPEAALAEVLAPLGGPAAGEPLPVARLRRLAELGREVGALAARLPERAPLGVVLGGETAARVASFPWNSFAVPVVASGGADPAAVAGGVAAASTAAAVAEARTLRLARLELERPGEAAHAAATLADLAWPDLEADERALCSPWVLVLDEEAVATSAGALHELLDGTLPVKVALLADPRLAHDHRSAAAFKPHAMAPALLRQLVATTDGPPVGQASPAAPVELTAAVAAAFGDSGPALLRLHAPRAARHGAAPAATLALARQALAAGDFRPLSRAAGPDDAAELLARVTALVADRERLSGEVSALAARLGGEPERLRQASRLELAREARGRLLGLLARRRAAGADSLGPPRCAVFCTASTPTSTRRPLSRRSS
jgi:ferredoxin